MSNRLLAVGMVAVMALSITACGKEEKKTSSGFISVDYNSARNLAIWEEKDRGI